MGKIFAIMPVIAMIANLFVCQSIQFPRKIVNEGLEGRLFNYNPSLTKEAQS